MKEIREVRVGIIGAGQISHRHMNIYSNYPNACQAVRIYCKGGSRS